jgi:hypothetical protein
VVVCSSEQIVIPIHHKGMPRVYPNRNEWVADGAGGLRFDNAIRHPLPCAGETVSVRFGAPIDVRPSFSAPRAPRPAPRGPMRAVWAQVRDLVAAHEVAHGPLWKVRKALAPRRTRAPRPRGRGGAAAAGSGAERRRGRGARMTGVVRGGRARGRAVGVGTRGATALLCDRTARAGDPTCPAPPRAAALRPAGTRTRVAVWTGPDAGASGCRVDRAQESLLLLEREHNPERARPGGHDPSDPRDPRHVQRAAGPGAAAAPAQRRFWSRWFRRSA